MGNKFDFSKAMKIMTREQRIPELNKEIEKYEDLVKKKDAKWDYSNPWDEYTEYMAPEWKKLEELSREKRLIQPYKLSEMSDFGDQMSLDDFQSSAEDGGFIDYDGHGYYTKDGKESDVLILPSDVKNKMVRGDFDSIIWFNK